MQTLFRHAAYDDPWWVNENRNPGRYNDAGRDSTQYLCEHPLGVSAEFLRHLGREAAADIKTMRMRMWAARADVQDLPELTFATAAEFGLTPPDLVAEELHATQQLARELRGSGQRGLIAPSAALPGTRIVVLFGPRLSTGWLDSPLDDLQLPTAHVIDGAPATEILPHVRWPGSPHAGLVQWQTTGLDEPFADPRVGVI